MLPRKVTAKFVTAVFIESEDYIEEQRRNLENRSLQYCNVDCEAILFAGKKLVLSDSNLCQQM